MERCVFCLGNSNMHQQRSLDREPSAAEILRDKDSALYMYLDE